MLDIDENDIENNFDDVDSNDGVLDAGAPSENEAEERAAASESDGEEITAEQQAEVDEAIVEVENQTFVDSFQLLSVIESLLFASDRPLSMGALKQVFANTNVDTKMLKRALEELAVICADPSRGVVLEEVTGGWQLHTKLDNMDFLKKISKARPFRLSGPALEVLSIIAYKQPIVKNEIDQIRGVESGHLVRALMEKDLVNFEGKTDLPGKPMAYATTRKFLEIFGLRNLGELPTLSEIDQLLPDGIGEEQEKETLGSVADMLATSVTAVSYSEGEEELSNITEKIQSIDTSSEFFEQEKIRQKQKKDRERAEDIREALAMSEDVDKKDIKWLEKYEMQMIAEQQAAEAKAAELLATPEATIVSTTEVVEFEMSAVESEVIPGLPEDENLDADGEMYFQPTIKESFVEGETIGEEVVPEEVDFEAGEEEDSESFTDGEI
jgi:segregation and condensation protein B